MTKSDAIIAFALIVACGGTVATSLGSAESPRDTPASEAGLIPPDMEHISAKFEAASNNLVKAAEDLKRVEDELAERDSEYGTAREEIKRLGNEFALLRGEYNRQLQSTDEWKQVAARRRAALDDLLTAQREDLDAKNQLGEGAAIEASAGAVVIEVKPGADMAADGGADVEGQVLDAMGAKQDAIRAVDAAQAELLRMEHDVAYRDDRFGSMHREMKLLEARLVELNKVLHARAVLDPVWRKASAARSSAYKDLTSVREDAVAVQKQMKRLSAVSDMPHR